MAGKAQDALEVFPLPVWECIIKKLKEGGSSNDVLNCSNVCTEFQRILEPTKHEWLFGSIFPFMFPYVKGSEVLACRGVCKNWRRGVDAFLEDFETWRPFNEGTSDISRSTGYDPLQQRGIKWTNLRNENALEDFLEGMKKQEMTTPFVLRSLSLGGWKFRERMGSEFSERALELLSLYGGHVWNLRVEPKEFVYDSWEFYEILKQILDNTPNLKTLSLGNLKIARSKSESETEPDSLEMDAFKDEKSTLENLLLEDKPLPEIDSLETLEIYATSSPPVLIFEKVISQINLGNLKCLKLHHLYLYNAKPYAVVRPLEHITELHVSGIHFDDLEHILNNIISPNAPLGKFCLRVGGVEMKKGIYVDRTCTIINRWKGTLRMLAIKGYMNLSFEDPEPEISLSALDIPNLKSLELEEIRFGPGFIPPAITATLEFLHIRYIGRHGPRVDPGKNFYKCVFHAGQLHNSFVWGEMEKLKVIRVERTYWNGTESVACTREMHECGITPKLGKNKKFDSDDEDDEDL